MMIVYYEYGSCNEIAGIHMTFDYPTPSTLANYEAIAKERGATLSESCELTVDDVIDVLRSYGGNTNG